MSVDFPDSSIYKPFFGEPTQVVEAFESLGDLGFDRVTVSPVDPSHFESLAVARASL